MKGNSTATITNGIGQPEREIHSLKKQIAPTVISTNNKWANPT